MENNNNQIPEEDWLEQLLSSSLSDEDLAADTASLSDADIGELSDSELQKIIQETIAEDWDVEDFAPDTESASYMDEDYQDTEDTMMQDEAYADAYEEDAAEDPDPDAPVRKVRPKRKKNGYGLFGLPHLASTIIWIAIVAITGISLGRLLWVCASDVLAFGRPDQQISVTITKEDNLDTISQKLYDAGLIKYPELFKLYGSISGAEKKFDAGTYELNTLFDYHALVNAMGSSSLRSTVEVTISEGYNCAQIFALLEKKGVCTAAALEEYAATSQFSSYWFLEDIPKGNKYCLEGFLFPDTYEFFVGDDPQRVYSILLGQFEKKFNEELQGYIVTLNENLAKKLQKNGFSAEEIESRKITLYDVVTVASIIQKEGKHSGEYYNLSAFIYNRLTNPEKYPHLECMSTLYYALGGKTDLTLEDFQNSSPYNTYVAEGLTPGPIANPGVSALMAAVSPADQPYYYFAFDYGTNENVFFEKKSDYEAFVNNMG